MIQIIFDEEKDRREGYIDCCHIIIDDHGIKQQKVIRTETLYELLEKAKKMAFFEIIFMTYSYVHRMINQEAFPKQTNLYNQEIMTGRGKGKYTYNKDVRQEAEIFLRDLMRKYFPHNEIKYIV